MTWENVIEFVGKYWLQFIIYAGGVWGIWFVIKHDMPKFVKFFKTHWNYEE